MSKYVSYQPVEGVFNHPNADRLSIVRIGGRETVHPTEEAKLLRPGDMVAYFPPGILISPARAIQLGVDQYCLMSKWNGQPYYCRVDRHKFRRVSSHGFIVPDCKIPEDELDKHFGALKYKPTVKGDTECASHPQFPCHPNYTKRQYLDVRLGVVKTNGDWRYMVGSQRDILKNYSKQTQKRSDYWFFLDENTMGLLNHLCDGSVPVVIYANWINDYTGDHLKIYDVMVDGEFLLRDILRSLCELYHLKPSQKPGA